MIWWDRHVACVLLNNVIEQHQTNTAFSFVGSGHHKGCCGVELVLELSASTCRTTWCVRCIQLLEHNPFSAVSTQSFKIITFGFCVFKAGNNLDALLIVRLKQCAQLVIS